MQLRSANLTFQLRQFLAKVWLRAQAFGRGLAKKGWIFRQIVADLECYKLPLALCIIYSLAVALPDQSLELYRYTVQTGAEAISRGWQGVQPSGLLQCLALVLSVCLLSISTFWLCSHCDAEVAEQSPGVSPRRVKAIWLIVAALPCVATAVGFARSTANLQTVGFKPTLLAGALASISQDLGPAATDLAQFAVESQLQMNAWLYIGSAVMLAVLMALAFGARLARTRRKEGANAATHFVALGLVLPLVLSLAFAVSSVRLPRMLTPFGIICLFFIMMGFFLFAIRILSRRIKAPLALALVVTALLFGLANDNHRIREVPITRQQMPDLRFASVGDGFRQWLAARKDRSEDKDYPVYVVAAEGGGIFAAFRTATFLASVQDLCPRFSHHLFAISSVSGGSVGAAVFAGLAQKARQSEDRFKPGMGCPESRRQQRYSFVDAAEIVLKDDFLSPVLAGFLFPDLLQRLIFFPIPALDRSRALEESLEAAWDQLEVAVDQRTNLAQTSSSPEAWLKDGNPLRESFTAMWRPEKDVPALFINTTEVACGRGRIISPFPLTTADQLSFPLRGVASGDNSHMDIALSTAAVLSARFPWLTPPGWFYSANERTDWCGNVDRAAKQKVHLVDGGYIDNSGVVTALAIMEEIRAAAKELGSAVRIRLNLIVLTSGGFTQPEVLFSDIVAPFQTLLSTRSARGSIAVRQAEREIAGHAFDNAPGISAALRRAELDGFGYPLPLGWRLSPMTRLLILGQNGNAGACSSDSRRDTALQSEVDCLKRDIRAELE